MQDSIRRQKAGMISPLTAINYLRDLTDAKTLEPATAEYLLKLLREAQPFHGGCRFAMPRVSSALEAEVLPQDRPCFLLSQLRQICHVGCQGDIQSSS
jgi:hypothetical protein